MRALVDAAHARGIYVILDIVLNHVGDVFEYALADGGGSGLAPWRDDPPYAIRWRDADGHGRPDWPQLPADPPRDAAIWPRELQRNEFVRRRGNAFDRSASDQEAAGDFYTLKELVTGFRETTPERGVYFPVRDTLIRAHQYLIAKYDIDGFRIDTLKYIEPEFARVFGNAIREYAQSIGKKNFFTFGEVYDDEAKIARFIGRNALESGRSDRRRCRARLPALLQPARRRQRPVAAELGQRRVCATPADPARDRQLARRREPLLRDLPGQPRPAQPLLLQRSRRSESL